MVELGAGWALAGRTGRAAGAGVGASRALGVGRRRAWLACGRERVCGRR